MNDDLPPEKSEALALLDRYRFAPWALLAIGLTALAGGLIAWCSR